MNTNLLALIPVLVPDIQQIILHNKIIFVVDITYKTGFILLANILIYQHFNFYILQTNKLDIV